MGVTSSFLNKKQRASYGNSTSSENRNKGSMGMYGGNGDDDQGDDNGTSSTNTNSTTTNADGNTAKTEVTPKIPLPERVKYADLSDIANTVRELGYSVETEADKKKREEAERKKKLRTSISDGLSALASAFFVHAGGLPTYDPKDNAYNRLKAELKEGETKREKQRAEWLAAMERAVARNREDVNAENAHNWKEYGAKVDDARYKEGMDLKREELAETKSQNQFNQGLATKKQNHQEYVDNENLNLAKYKANIAAEKERGEFIAYDAKGKKHVFKDRDAADDFAKREGTYEYIYVKKKVQKPDKFGRVVETIEEVPVLVRTKGKTDDGNNQKVMPGVQPSNKMPGVK